ncbi:hypothetical protein MKZ38_005321 [Zalerion maritima]|uniref:Aromatic-L-amino-acid decarboxylase n=1 Tax=Zalerion maritima TaxID=339359 RepID=A0AAD5RKJ9_9PEZI|nr:hypothetical protein MKZ38_005321 [Zalerion maritima]
MDSKEFKEAAISSIEEITNYYETIPTRRVVSSVSPGYLRTLLPQSAPQDPEPWSSIQSDIESKIMPGITHWQHPNFMAFFPASSSYPGMLGEMWSAALNGAAFNWICSPAVTELETIVLDWLAKSLGLPERYLSTGKTGGGGVIHGTASEAIVTVLVAARDKYLRESTAHLEGGGKEEEREDEMMRKRSRLVALASGATHSSAKKAALIAGVRFHPIPVGAETGWALTGRAVGDAIEELRARGLEPFFLAATMGTTDTCAVDDFGGICSAVRELAPGRAGEDGRAGMWVHVDAAYAGVSLMLPEVREMAPLEALLAGEKDEGCPVLSINTNMHKWGLVNFDCSTLWVMNRTHLTDYLTVMPAYLRNQYSDSGLVTDYRDWQIPLGRRFRSLKLWFVLRTYGIKGLQEHFRKGIRLGELFASLVTEEGGKGRDLFEIVTGPAFALTVFRVKGKDREERNRRTKEVYERVNAGGEIYITSTVLGGDFAIRVVASTPFVEEEHVRNAFAILVRTAEEVAKEEGGSG